MAKFRLSAFADEASPALSEQIEALREAGVGMVELRGVNGKNVSTLTVEEAKEAKKMLDEGGIAVSSIGSPYGKIKITDDFAPHMELFKKGMELTKILGAQHVRMFSFYMPEGEAPEAYKDEVFARLDKMACAAREAGVQLLHENEKGIYGDTDERCLEILKEFSGRILGVFDPANFLQCKVKPIEAMAKLKDYIAYMHIKDAIFADGSVVPCGMGDGNLPEILSTMAQRADGMVLSLEPHLTVFDGLKGLQDEEVKHKFVYESSRAAFAAAADALKATLDKIGFKPLEGSTGTWML
ncbi:MAG: sugar phosphate isomerase/epimerase [Clostridia bacterium]|nr:sugar phosphate isomerase/epimerase [Clostridia bacterium]